MTISKSIKFKNSYAKELSEICERCTPHGFNKSEIVLKNFILAKELGLSKKFVESNECLEIFSGVSLPDSSQPIAQGYCGHQFGHFNPQLGDGRAVLLGEINNKDIQLKGIGQTPFSRRGDGKSSLGPVLREYIVSEFMHSIKIPTTRALFALKTNETVMRETEQFGGVLTRVAKSHIRIGTFEYARSKSNKTLKSLADYSINRHYPELNQTDNKYLSFFAAVCDKQALLISKWMSVGFIHGVMNTDNMTISGETIDYGPCAFMDIYDPKTVFSSIDKMGRYAYCNQPIITKWNLTRFAECLIPLIDKDKDKAIELATEAINTFEKKYEEKWMFMMKNKLGLFGSDNSDKFLILDLLTWMHENKVDYTNTFCHLMDQEPKKNEIYKDKNFLVWKNRWKERLLRNNTSPEKSFKLMRDANPLVIPRNHKVEEALEAAEQNNLKPIYEILEILNKPYTQQKNIESYQYPLISNKKYQTFCGT